MPVKIQIAKKISTQIDRYGNTIKTTEEDLGGRGTDKVSERTGETKEAKEA